MSKAPASCQRLRDETRVSSALFIDGGIGMLRRRILCIAGRFEIGVGIVVESMGPCDGAFTP